MNTEKNIKNTNSSEASFSSPSGRPGGAPIIKDDEIDLVALVKTIWDGRKTIYYSVGIAILIGLIIAFTSPAKYTAYATLLPSDEKKSGNLGSLGALAGMAGINLGAMMGDASGIPAEIYPEVVNSYPFLKEMIHEKFHFEDYNEPISIYDYAVADTIESFGSTLIKYTIRLPWTVKNAIFSKKDQEQPTDSPDYGVLNMSNEELAAMDAVLDLIQIAVDKKTGLIYVSVEAGEPVVTAQYVQKAVELLQEYIIRYKTKQVRENLSFVQARFDEKKGEYETIQKAFFEYKDKHRNVVSERIDSEYQQLSDEYDMISTVYKGLAQQLEQAKIAVMEETPAFTVLEPAKIPIKKSSPNKKMILAASIFLGGFVGLGWIIGSLIYGKFKEGW